MKFRHFALRMRIPVAFVLLSFLASATESPEPTKVRSFVIGLDRAVQEISYVLESPESVIDATGDSPEALATWVRENIRYEPYLGVVKGPVSTFTTRSGNDWDRALLLKHLLKLAGIESGISVLQRSREETEELARHVSMNPKRDIEEFESFEFDKSRAFLEEFGLDSEESEESSTRGDIAWETIHNDALTAYRSFTDEDLNAVMEAAGRKRWDWSKWNSSISTVLKDRVVVVLTETPDAVLDLSPTGPDLADLEDQKMRAYRKIPGNRMSEFTVALELNVVRPNGSLKRYPLLQQKRPIYEWEGAEAKLTIAPKAPKTLPFEEDWEAEDWYKWVSGFDSFEAILDFGKESIRSKPFDRNGNWVEDEKTQGRTAGSLMGGMNSGFTGGRDLSKKPGAENQFHSIVAVFSLKIPGEPVSEQQRLICGDLSKNDFVFDADLMVSSHLPDPEVAALKFLKVLKNHTIGFMRAVGELEPPKSDLDHYSSVLNNWILLRKGFASAIESKSDGLTFRNRPVVVMQSNHIKLDEDSKSVSLMNALDVIFDQSHWAPDGEGTVDAAFEENIRSGFANSLIEQSVLSELFQDLSVQGAVQEWMEKSNPVATMTSAKVLRDFDRLSPLGTWALQNSRPHSVILTASESAQDTWWQIDPARGTSIGRGQDGKGQSATEYVQITLQNVRNLKCVLKQYYKVLVFGAGDEEQQAEQAAKMMICVTGLDTPSTYFKQLGVLGKFATLFQVGDLVYDITEGASGFYENELNKYYHSPSEAVIPPWMWSYWLSQ